MPPHLRIDADALARHVIRHGRAAKGLRPVGFRLDSEGINLGVTLPGPDWLAVMLTLGDLDAFRDGARLVVRPHGHDAEPEALDLPVVAGSLRETVRALPERDDAGDAYRDLRLAAGTPSARFGEYALDVGRAYVQTLPALPKRPKAPRQRLRTRTPLERQRAGRVRRSADERASAEWGLSAFIAIEAPEPHARLSGSAVFDFVADLLAYAVERHDETVVHPDPRDAALYRSGLAERRAAWDEIRVDEWEDPPPGRPRPVSRRVLFEVAEDIGAFRVTRPRGSVALTVIEAPGRVLSAFVTHCLRRAGVADPVEYAAATEERVCALAPKSQPESLDRRVVALPWQVVYAVALNEDGVRAFGRMAQAHIERHPEERDIIIVVARTLRDGDPDGLVAQMRSRCAEALRAEQASA
ncbi:hypothetical protein [Nocardioides conyzicola]|uniref:Uncharacterized protein n=1 Tax=Nocardioides conyzicola TaxID=1651781 RepID=A0ABP8WZ41_9ACTN